MKAQIKKIGPYWVFTPYPGMAKRSHFFNSFEDCCEFASAFITCEIAYRSKLMWTI